MMRNADLRAVFARLCADEPAGDVGDVSYETALAFAVRLLMRRSLLHWRH
jgi:hypothetical protein